MSEIEVKKENRKDLLSIQVLRGIACFMVLVAHTFPYDTHPEGNIYRLIAQKCAAGVEVFFIISGFILPYSMYKKNYRVNDIGTFFLKRIIRIEPPYIASIILLLLLNWGNTLSPLYHGPAYRPDWWNVLGHLGYLNAFTQKPWLNLVYWTLAIEFEYYIILALFFPLFTHPKKWVLFLSFFLFLSLTFIHQPYYLLREYTVYFAMGIALFLHQVKKVTTPEFIVLLLSAFAACFIKFDFFDMALSGGTLLFIQYVKKMPKFMLALGSISYSLYLTHLLIASRAIAFENKYMTFLPVNLRNIIGIMAAIAFAAVFYKLVEKPFQVLSKRKRYHK